MDKQEARRLLFQHLRPYLKWPYAQLRTLVGNEHVIEVQGQSGARFYFELSVALTNEVEDDLEVEGLISAVEGRNWFPAVENESFIVSPKGRVSSRTPELLDNA